MLPLSIAIPTTHAATTSTVKPINAGVDPSSIAVAINIPIAENTPIVISNLIIGLLAMESTSPCMLAQDYHSSYLLCSSSCSAI